MKEKWYEGREQKPREQNRATYITEHGQAWWLPSQDSVVPLYLPLVCVRNVTFCAHSGGAWFGERDGHMNYSSSCTVEVHTGARELSQSSPRDSGSFPRRNYSLER